MSKGPAGWKGTDARALAAELLRRIESEPTERASELLQSALARLNDGRDKALATELVYGVQRWQRRVDASLEKWMPKGLASVEPMARALLRVGAYQVRLLDRIPPEIAVSATQDAARAIGMARLTGLLNAVLRKVAGAPEALPTGSSDAAIGLRASLPDWIVAALRVAFGDAAVDAEAMALRERAKVSLRPTLGKGGAAATIAALALEGIEGREVAHGAVEISGGDPFRTSAMAQGLFVAQDGSGLVVIDEVAAACGVVAGGSLAGKRVLDLCAGRGVKAIALADRGATVVAVDVAGEKLDELMRVARRLGVADRIARTVALDAAGEGADAVLAGLGEFDAVLVDAPCTGLGTLRRHPEIAWRTSPRDVENLMALQGRLLNAGAARVAVGGGLVYAVCSFVRGEGEVSLPSRSPSLVWESAARLDLAPSSGLDAFQVRRWTRRS